MATILKMPKCPHCGSKDIMVFTCQGSLSITSVDIIFACYACKEMFRSTIEFERED
jgi:DNA-directed RNA polymerase subunit M/transcription elongation factor TFIIS